MVGAWSGQAGLLLFSGLRNYNVWNNAFHGLELAEVVLLCRSCLLRHGMGRGNHACRAGASGKPCPARGQRVCFRARCNWHSGKLEPLGFCQPARVFAVVGGIRRLDRRATADFRRRLLGTRRAQSCYTVSASAMIGSSPVLGSSTCLPSAVRSERSSRKSAGWRRRR